MNVEIYYTIPSVWMALASPGCLLHKARLALADMADQLWIVTRCDLSAGTQTFQSVGSLVGEDAFNAGQKLLLLVMLPVFRPYLLWPAAVAALLLLPVVLFLRRLQQLKKEASEIRKEQAYLVCDLERTISELECAREESYQQQQFMKRLAMVLSHDLQSPFRFLISNTEILHERLRLRDYKDSEALSLELKQSGEKTLQFLNDFTIWMKSISNSYKVRPERVSLPLLFEDLATFFGGQLHYKKNTLQYSVQGFTEIVTDRELLRIVLRNIIDNANKHCSEGTIVLDAGVVQGAGVITVCDNGNGIPEPVLAKVKEAILNHDQGMVNASPEGRQGYKFIAHFAYLLQMELTVDSKPGNGTCVRLGGLAID